MKFKFRQTTTVWWFLIRSRINCLCGNHDWLTTVKIFHLTGHKRQCANCQAKQIRTNDKWQNVP